MAKGVRKRAKSGCYFKVSNKCGPRAKKSESIPVVNKELEQQQDQQQAKGSNTTNNCEKTRQLRPRASVAENHVSGNKIVNISKMTEVMNLLYKDHAQCKGKCLHLNFEITEEVINKVWHGNSNLCVQIVGLCLICTLLSTKFPMVKGQQP